MHNMYSYAIMMCRLANVTLADDDNCMLIHLYDKMKLSNNHTHDAGINY